MRFNRGKCYSHYGAYSDNRGYSRGSRIRWERVGIIAGVVVLILLVALWFNFSRLKLFIKGYSFEQQNQILSLDSKAVDEVLSHNKLEHISDWIKTSKKYKYYDEYEYYLSQHKDTKVKAVVTLIDDVFENYVSRLKTLNYTQKQIWTILKTASASDVKYVVEHHYTYDDIEPFMKVKGFVFKDMEKYEKAYKTQKNYNYAVLVTSYPFIISKNGVNKSYIITNPEDILTLVKKGFYYDSQYEPKDLVTPDVLISPDCPKENSLMRKEAAKALQEMFKGAKNEGYNLVINSAYRSYASQKQTYDGYFKKYDPATAASLVALPGASEHQSGLGVDLTCQSVLDDKRNGIANSKFSYKPDYKWCAANCYKYGFILRFEGDKADITGIGNEEWHFRYVGKEAAKEIFTNGWTLEEYCLNKGIIPNIKGEEIV